MVTRRRINKLTVRETFLIVRVTKYFILLSLMFLMLNEAAGGVQASHWVLLALPIFVPLLLAASLTARSFFPSLNLVSSRLPRPREYILYAFTGFLLLATAGHLHWTPANITVVTMDSFIIGFMIWFVWHFAQSRQRAHEPSPVAGEH